MINVIVWLLFGVLAGGVASRLTDTITPTNVTLNSIAGMMGALMGGVVFLIFDTAPLNRLSMGAIAGALLGAILIVVLAQIMFRRPI